MLISATSYASSEIWYVVHNEKDTTKNGVYNSYYDHGNQITTLVIPSSPLPAEEERIIKEKEKEKEKKEDKKEDKEGEDAAEGKCAIRTFPNSQIAISPKKDQIAVLGVGKKLGDYQIYVFNLHSDTFKIRESCKKVWDTALFALGGVGLSNFIKSFDGDIRDEFEKALNPNSPLPQNLYDWGYKPAEGGFKNRFSQIKIKWNSNEDVNSLFIRVLGIMPGNDHETVGEHIGNAWRQMFSFPAWDFTNEWTSNGFSFELNIQDELKADNLSQTILPGETYRTPLESSKDNNSFLFRWLSISPDHDMFAIWEEKETKDYSSYQRPSETLRIQLLKSSETPKFITIETGHDQRGRMTGARRVILWQKSTDSKIKYIIRVLDTNGNHRKIEIPNTDELENILSTKLESNKPLIQDKNDLFWDIIYKEAIYPADWKPKSYVSINDIDDWQEMLEYDFDQIFFFNQKLDEDKPFELYNGSGAINPLDTSRLLFKPRRNKKENELFGLKIKTQNRLLPIGFGYQNNEGMHVFRHIDSITTIVELRSYDLNTYEDPNIIAQYVTDFALIDN